MKAIHRKSHTVRETRLDQTPDRIISRELMFVSSARQVVHGSAQEEDCVVFEIVAPFPLLWVGEHGDVTRATIVSQSATSYHGAPRCAKATVCLFTGRPSASCERCGSYRYRGASSVSLSSSLLPSPSPSLPHALAQSLVAPAPSSFPPLPSSPSSSSSTSSSTSSSCSSSSSSSPSSPSPSSSALPSSPSPSCSSSSEASDRVGRDLVPRLAEAG
mmetsp:Transcript_28985/g.75136  ORF Transcript_28985/g.75136 Transcript_28985/m.75136 type:complete len:216 (-) Transcript_28985:53-700(-)